MRSVSANRYGDSEGVIRVRAGRLSNGMTVSTCGGVPPAGIMCDSAGLLDSSRIRRGRVSRTTLPAITGR